MIKSNIKTKAVATTLVIIVANSLAISDVLASADADYSFNLDSEWHSCQQLGTDYQEVYAFETDSFYINICQKDHLYFYSGEPKKSDRSSIFIPTVPFQNNRGFQATNGNVTYLVVLPFSIQESSEISAEHPSEAILTIKRNDRLVTVESSLNKYCDLDRDTMPTASFATAFEESEQIIANHERIAAIPYQQDFGSGISVVDSPPQSLPKIFKSDARFDFYQVGGEIHRLTTCDRD